MLHFAAGHLKKNKNTTTRSCTPHVLPMIQYNNLARIGKEIIDSIPEDRLMAYNAAAPGDGSEARLGTLSVDGGGKGRTMHSC